MQHESKTESTLIAMPQESKTKSFRWGTALRWLVTVSVIGYLVHKLDWSVLLSEMLRADFRWLGLASLLYGVTFVLAAVRWWFLLRVQNIPIPIRVVTALTLIGQFFNTFMLGSIGGDVVKMVYLQRYAPTRRTHATLTIIMDRVLGLSVLLLGSLLAIPWHLRSVMSSEQGHTAIVGLAIVFAAIVVGAVAFAVVPFHRAPPRLIALWRRIPHHRVVELVVSGFRQHGAALGLTLASVAAAVLVTLVLTLASYCIAVAIGVEVGYLQLLVIVTVAICVTSLPISIGGHGVREGMFVLMFAAFGITGAQAASSQESAILFSVLFFSVPLIWSLIGGIVYLTYRHDYDYHAGHIERAAKGHAAR